MRNESTTPSASPIIRSIESRSFYRGASICPRSRKPTRCITGEFKPSSPRHHIEEFLESGGNIQIGRVSPLGHVAIASDEYTMLAALTRNAGEALREVIQRLDTAIELVVNHDTFTDKINDP